MRYIAMVVAVLVGLAFSSVCSATVEGKEKPESASAEKEARTPEKAVEARINANADKQPVARPDRNPVIRERQSQPADRHFIDVRQQSPFRP